MALQPDDKGAWEPPAIPERVYTENEISLEYGQAFDQDKVLEGYADDAMDQPYRYLSHWYLTKKGTDVSTSKRLVLPGDLVFRGGDDVVRGWLHPAGNEAASQQPICIELSALEFYSVDRTKIYRGFWFHSPAALYRIQLPDKTIPAPNLPSQEQLHLPSRAKLAILSNIIDKVLHVPNAIVWAGKTVTQVHKELTAAANGTEPFNKVLLAKFNTFVAQHLDAGAVLPFHRSFTNKSSFVKSLKTMKSKGSMNNNKLIELTLQAEAISEQTAWGESVMGFLDDDMGSMEGMLLEPVELDQETEQALALTADSMVDNSQSASGDASTLTLVVDAMPLQNGSLSSEEGVADQLSDTNDEVYEEKPTKILKKTVKKAKAVIKKPVKKKRAGATIGKLPRKKKVKVESNTGVWSSKKNKEALLSLKKFLDPQPTAASIDFSSWLDTQHHGFTIPDETRAKALAKEIGEWEVHMKSLECLLLVVEAFRNTCVVKLTDAARKLLLASKSGIAIIIFDSWRKRAAALLQERLDAQKSVQDTPELYLLVSVLDSIADCQLVKTAKTLAILKGKGLDWAIGVEEIRPLCEKLQNQKLSQAYERAKLKLQRIREDNKAAPLLKSATISQSVAVPHYFKGLVGKAASPSSAEPATPGDVLVTKIPVAEKTVSEADTAYMEGRRKRLLAMTAKQAGVVSVQQTPPSGSEADGTPGEASAPSTSKGWGTNPQASSRGSKAPTPLQNKSSDSAVSATWGSMTSTNASAHSAKQGSSWGSKPANKPLGQAGGSSTRTGGKIAWGSKTYDSSERTGGWGTPQNHSSWGSKPLEPTTAVASSKFSGGHSTKINNNPTRDMVGVTPRETMQQSAPVPGRGRDGHPIHPDRTADSGNTAVRPAQKTSTPQPAVQLPRPTQKETANIPQHSSRAIGARSQSTSGRGRGNNINLPAWMTRKGDIGIRAAAISQSLPASEQSHGRDVVSSHRSSHERDREPLRRSQDDRSYARGRETTRRSRSPEERPSRRSLSPEDRSYSRNRESSRRSRSPEDRPYSRDREPSYLSRSTDGVQFARARDSRSSYPSGSAEASGTGRGSNRNLPAWMTQGPDGPGSERAEPRMTHRAPPGERSALPQAPRSSYAALGTAPPRDASGIRDNVRKEYIP